MNGSHFAMPSAEQAKAVFGVDFNPKTTLNGNIALAAAGSLAIPAIALMKAVSSCAVVDVKLLREHPL